MKLHASFLGLGAMGSAMASNLLKSGVELTVYNRSPEKANALVKAGAKQLSSPREAFEEASIVFSMVANDQALLAITEGENGLLANAKPGNIHVSLSTISAKLSRQLIAKHKEKGVEFVVATVFGRPDAAASRSLWICLAGNEEAKKQVEPYLHFLGKKIYDVGIDPVAANIVKLSGNFLILATVEALSEAYAFAEKNGVPAQQVHNIFTDSLFPTAVHQNYGQIIISQKFEPAGFKMNLGLKDIDLLLRAAEESRVPLPIAGLLHDRLLAGLANNRGDMDWSAIAMTEQAEAGLSKP